MRYKTDKMESFVGVGLHMYVEVVGESYCRTCVSCVVMGRKDVSYLVVDYLSE
jgi:hypothetical protein